MRAQQEAEFASYVAARLPALRRTAFFLCGEWHQAEDLAQKTLINLYGAWSRLRDVGAVDGYARQVLVRVYLDERRRPWRRESSHAELPDTSTEVSSLTEDRDMLMRALAELPRQQRAVVVLRYWEDLSVEETAYLLDISGGTVKSHASRGLEHLRRQLPQLSGFTLEPSDRS